MINGTGYEQSQLMIIGDYARKADVASQLCLSGYYKSKLQEFLKSAGYSIDQCYRTCIIKDYIQGLGTGTWGQDKKLLEYYFESSDTTLIEYVNIIIEEINLIKPTVIIGLGEYALRMLTNKIGIGKWRGSVLPLAADINNKLGETPWTLKVVSTYHPLIIQTEEHNQFLIRLDFKKATDLVFNPGKPIDYHEIVIARHSMDLLRFIERYPFMEYQEMTIDIETNYGFITCLGISFDGFAGICIPLFGATSIEVIERARMLHLLSQLLVERDLINQNIAYDKRISARFGLRLDKIKWDTILAAAIIAPDFPKRLDFLTSIYTDMSFYKDEGREFDPRTDSIDQLYKYNVKDAITTFQVYIKQKEDLAELGMLEFFMEFMMPLFELYYQNDSVGIKVDFVKRKALQSKYESLLDLKKLEVNTITKLGQCEALNTASPTQIGKFMEANNFPVLRHRVESGFMIVNTDVDSLAKMRIASQSEYDKCTIGHENAIRFINLILLIRRLEKVLDYIAVGVHPWGRIHTSSKLHATSSGRSAASQTSDGIPEWTTNKKGVDVIKYKQLGQSFQTVTKHGFIIEGEDTEDIIDGVIGKDIREMYIPDTNMGFVEVDGRQAEARVCEVLAEDYNSLSRYDKIDIHCEVASMIFNSFTYDDIFRMAKIDKSDEGLFMRNIGKHSKHAKNNGMEEYLFAIKYLHMASFKDSLHKAHVILTRLDKAYPGIENVFHREVEKALRETRSLTSPKIHGVPCGRKRMFYKKIDKHYLNVAYSYLPQSTISDHTKAAMLRIASLIDNTKAWLIVENHDSITALVHYRYIRKYIAIATAELMRGIDFRNCTLSRDYELIIPCEFSIGRKSWGKMKDIKRIKP